MLRNAAGYVLFEPMHIKPLLWWYDSNEYLVDSLFMMIESSTASLSKILEEEERESLGVCHLDLTTKIASSVCVDSSILASDSEMSFTGKTQQRVCAVTAYYEKKKCYFSVKTNRH